MCVPINIHTGIVIIGRNMNQNIVLLIAIQIKSNNSKKIPNIMKYTKIHQVTIPKASKYLS